MSLGGERDMFFTHFRNDQLFKIDSMISDFTLAFVIDLGKPCGAKTDEFVQISSDIEAKLTTKRCKRYLFF